MSKFIIGMTKSGLDSKSGKVKTLLADFEQLANCVKNDERVSKAYILVYDDKIKKLVSNWYAKNGVNEDQLEILTAIDHPIFNEEEVRAEKFRNARGITPDKEPGDSIANISKKMFEEILAIKLSNLHDCENMTKSSPIGSIGWDFVGKLNNVE